MSHDYDPAKQPCDPKWGPIHGCGCISCYGATPAGNKQLVDQNEKGVLEEGIFKVPMTVSPLGSDHSANMQGVYREHA